jgi:hypothetical protein
MAETTGINIGSDELPIDTDGLLAADSDVLVPTQKAVKTYVDAHATAAVDTDGTLAANSDVKVASQKATKTFGNAIKAACTLAPVSAPGTASSAGVAGTWAYDATHIYVCVATNTWVRATLATF